MSELKYQLMLNKDMSWVPCYLKSEADKVIADLEESHKKEVGQLLIEIAELEKEKEYAIEQTAEVINGQERELQHHKYKRCLAMTERCLTEKVYWHYRYNDYGDKGYTREYKWRKVELWRKWAMRWLAIAEKFKTNSIINGKEA
jgi:hypothetical protein